MFSENASFPPVCIMFFSTPFISVFSVVKFNTHAQAEKIKNFFTIIKLQHNISYREQSGFAATAP